MCEHYNEVLDKF